MSIFNKLFSPSKRSSAKSDAGISAEQTDWVRLKNDDIYKRWSLTGPLQSGEELKIEIEIDFMESLLGSFEPNVTLRFKPNVLGVVDDLVVVQFSDSTQPADTSSARAMMTVGSSEAILVLLDNYSIVAAVNMLMQNRFFRLTIMSLTNVLLFDMAIPNSTKELAPVFNAVRSGLQSRQSANSIPLFELVKEMAANKKPKKTANKKKQK